MKVYEILEFNRELIERLGRAGIRLDDARYLDLYADYERMVGSGCKVTYVMAFLSAKYGVCERKAYSLVKRLKSDCKDLCRGGVKRGLPAANAVQRDMRGRCRPSGRETLSSRHGTNGQIS